VGASRSGGPAALVVVAVIGLLAVCLVFFISQTVIVDDERVELRMGPGVIRRRVPLADIEAVEQLHLPWWAVAYGIRMSLDGRRQLWRVSGSDTVDLRLSDGRRLLIATDEPDALATVIRLATEATR
jgi:hypothetical protein